MKINTIINMFPRFKGYHIWDIDESRFVPAKEVRRLMKSYVKQTNEMIARYEDDEEFKLSFENEDDVFDWFRMEFLEQHDGYDIIEIPNHLLAGIYDKEPKEYVRELKQVMKQEVQ